MDSVKKRLKLYFDNSGIHGLRYITQPGRHISERIFWLVVCHAAAYSTFHLFKNNWHYYQNSSISFGVETSFLEWNTTLPAFSVCELGNFKRIMELKKRYGSETDFRILDSVVYYRGECHFCDMCEGSGVNCPNTTNLDLKYKTPCHEIFVECVWMDTPFDCCSQFLPLKTEFGLCYTINSLQTKKNENQLRFIVNLRSGLGRFKFVVKSDRHQLTFIHSPMDVPYYNHPLEEKITMRGDKMRLLLARLSITEIVNEPLVRDTAIEKRKCRFPEENNLGGLYPYYGYSACVVHCRNQRLIELCNCSNHLLPKVAGVEFCGVDGLDCASRNTKNLRTLKRADKPGSGLGCHCPVGCLESEYKIEVQREPKGGSKDRKTVLIHMTNLPTERFKRSVVRTGLDLVVSMGGAAGLFLGASLLSTVEFIYYMFIRRKSLEEETETSANEELAPARTVTSVEPSRSGHRPLRQRSWHKHLFD